MSFWESGNPEGVFISEVGCNKVLISFKNIWRDTWATEEHEQRNRQNHWGHDGDCYRSGRSNEESSAHENFLKGYSKKECNKEIAMASWNPKVPRYTPGIGVDQAKSLNTGERRRWKQNKSQEGDEEIEARDIQNNYKRVKELQEFNRKKEQ
ncbi:hypothetical protein AHAS_Ahas20G0051900 [Arachis hypogaea]